MKDLIARLRIGYVCKAKRWSGDTHAEFSSGEVDTDATDKTMRDAADTLEASAEREAALQSRLEAAEKDAERYRWLRENAEFRLGEALACNAGLGAERRVRHCLYPKHDKLGITT